MMAFMKFSLIPQLFIRKKSAVSLLCLLLFLFTSPLSGDVVVLKSGKKIEGWIIEDNEEEIRINTGYSVIIFPREEVESVQKGLAVPLLENEVKKVLREGERLVSQGKLEEARKLYEAEMLELDREFSAYDDIPPEALALKKSLDLARHKTIPPDPTSQKVENLYRQALKVLDRVHYEEAFELLEKADSYNLNRTDVLMRLGMVARQLNRSDVAIDAFERLLERDAKTYYGEVSDPLLHMIDRRGKELLKLGEQDKAIRFYKLYLLLREQTGNQPVDLETFQNRLEKRSGEKEQDILMSIFNYADEHDMVDLANASISRVKDLDPDNEKIKKLAAETEFIWNYIHTIREGDLKAAVLLKNQTPEHIIRSERVADKLGRFSEDFSKELKVDLLFIEAKNALEEGRYGKSKDFLDELFKQFPDEVKARKAKSLMEKVAFEIPIQKALEESYALAEAGKIDEAERIIRKTVQIDNIKSSSQWDELKAFFNSLKEERKALEIWKKVLSHLGDSDYSPALSLVDNLAHTYDHTYAGKKAVNWLDKEREGLAFKVEEQNLVKQGLFTPLTDPVSMVSADKVPPGLSSRGRDRFRKVLEIDKSRMMSNDMPWFLWGAPSVLALLIVIIIIMVWAWPGKGKFGQPAPIKQRAKGSIGGPDVMASKVEVCRFCGLTLPRNADVCPHCGADANPSDIEDIRKLSMIRHAEFDPWDIRVGEQKENRFDEFYNTAREYLEKDRIKLALDMAEKAYREDPHEVKGLRLLAELHERAKNPEKAALCYHKMSMLQPDNMENIKKLESMKSSLTPTPLKLGPLIPILSFSIWWVVFWVSVTLEPWLWLPRGVLAILGAFLTIRLWGLRQKKAYLTVSEKPRCSLDFQYPVPGRRLSWRELNRQAKTVSRLISEHTGVDVPVLKSWRLVVALGLSFLFLLSLSFMAWINQTPLVILGWIGALILLVYLLEIHPRALSAYVLLRHLYEETHTPWADPELPFKPKLIDYEVKGEFNINSLEDFPLKWALNPIPNSKNRQGILNGLLQFMNRHYKCHFFYDHLHINKKFEMPIPVGFRRLTGFTVLLCVITILASLFTLHRKISDIGRFQQHLERGYQELLDGKLDMARDDFFDARRYHEQGFASPLYLGHTLQKMNLPGMARRFFRSATRKGNDILLVHNDYAYFLIKQEHLSEAISEYRRALQMDKRNSDILNNIGAAFYKRGEFQKAVEYLNQAVVINPRHERAYTTLGMVYEELDQRENARKAYQNALKHAPGASYTGVARNRLERDLAPAFEFPADGGLHERKKIRGR